MVLTVLQTAEFFTNKMGIPPVTVVQLATVGTTTIKDLIDYDKDLFKCLKDDLCKPTGMIPDPNDAGRVVPQAPYILTPLSFKKLTVATKMVVYYQTTGYNHTLGSLRWTGLLTLFSQYLKALKNQKADDNKEPPKVTRSLPIGQWSKAFQISLEKTLGARDIPLAYVTRTKVILPPATPPLWSPNRPYSTVHESAIKKLIAHASHTHTLSENDNEEVYYHLELLPLCTTQYAVTLSPFKRRKNGSSTYMSIIQHKHQGRSKEIQELSQNIEELSA
jgi:hypothetical protein